MSSIDEVEMCCRADEFTAEPQNVHCSAAVSGRMPALEAPVVPCDDVWAALEELHWAAPR